MGDLAKLSRLDPIPRQYKVLINWGNPTAFHLPNWGTNGKRWELKVLNKPEAIAKAINKLTALTVLRENNVRVPEFSTDKPDGVDRLWLARTNLCGSGGAGITIIRKGDVVPAAPLYVVYVPKRVEYRVHVFQDEAIFVQQKKRKSDAEQTADQKLIRNYDNGWVFCPVNMDEVTQETKDAAIAAVRAMGLDFGAVDLIIGRDDNHPYVLEINSAPGLESPGLIDVYVSRFSAFTKEA